MKKARRHTIYGSAGFLLGYLMYRNVPLSILICTVFLAYSLVFRKRERKETVHRINECFREFLVCLEPLLKTSGTFPGSFGNAFEDYERMYGRDELYGVLKGAVLEMEMNRSTGLVLENLASRIGSEDARLFASCIAITEESGGNVVEMTDRIVGIITEKIRMKDEIRHLLAAKRFEHILVSIIPVAILLLLSAGTDSYLNPLYETTAGRIVMTAAGLMFAASWYVGNAIMSIEV